MNEVSQLGLDFISPLREVVDITIYQHIKQCTIWDDLHEYMKEHINNDIWFSYYTDETTSEQEMSLYYINQLLYSTVAMGTEYILGRYDRISSINYKNYLKSDYWNCFRTLKIYNSSYKCQICSCKENLNVHHNNYKRKGFEFIFDEDTVVLCNRCHKQYHKGMNNE